MPKSTRYDTFDTTKPSFAEQPLFLKLKYLASLFAAFTFALIESGLRPGADDTKTHLANAGTQKHLAQGWDQITHKHITRWS